MYRPKTESEMLDIAVKLVNEDENARVMFFLPTWPRCRALFGTLKQAEYDGDCRAMDMKYTAKNGATLSIRAITPETLCDIGGLQMSHAFWVGVGLCVPGILNRVRSRHQHAMEPGAYSPYAAMVMKLY